MSAPLETTDDAFLGDRLRILQPRDGYRAGLDAVLLAATVDDQGRPFRVLDIGAGVGVAGLSVARRCPEAAVVLVEREPALVALGRANIARNELGGRACVIEGDVTAPWERLAAAGLEREAFDQAIANPPFGIAGDGTRARDPLKAAAHVMAGGDLDAWIRLMATALGSGGLATVIHRAEALASLLQAFTRRFGEIAVTPVMSRAAEPARRVLVRGRKGSRGGLRLLPPIVLHTDDGAFTPPVEAALRGGAALAFR